MLLSHRLPTGQAGSRQRVPPLTQLRALGTCVLTGGDEAGDVAAPPTCLATLFPSLTSLALGLCPHTAACAAAGLSPSEQEARAAAQVAAAAADMAAPGAAGPQGEEPAAVRVAPLLPQLRGLQGLAQLSVAGQAAAQLARELAHGTLPAAQALPALTSLHIHHVPSYEQLCALMRLLVQLQSLEHLGLHHCCTRRGPERGAGSAAAAQQPQQPHPLGLAGGVPAGLAGGGLVAHGAAAGAAVVPVGMAQAAGGDGFGWGVDGTGDIGPEAVAHAVCGAGGLRHLEVTGGDLRLVQHISAQPAHFSHLTLSLNPLVSNEELETAARVRGVMWHHASSRPQHAQNAQSVGPRQQSSHQGHAAASAGGRHSRYRVYPALQRISVHCCRLVAPSELSVPHGTDVVATDWRAADRTLAIASTE